MKNARKIILPLFITYFVLLLSSCGSHLEVNNDVLVIGMECNYQPFNWTENKANEHTLPIYGTNEFCDGYDVQVAKFLSNELNKDVYIKKMEWDSLIPALQNNEINMVLAGMTDTPARRENINFTNPYLESDLAFLIRTENMPEGYGTIDNPASYSQLLELFDGKSLVCQANVVGDEFIDTYFVNNGSGVNISHHAAAKTYPLAAQDVKGKSAFAMPAELPVVSAMTNIGELSVLYCDYSFLSDEDINGLSVSIGTKKGNDEFTEELNSALEKLTDELRDQYMGEAANRSASNAN
ncbi:MAG: transporter substrate-binding domain-containing protein [Bacilli bacterium]